MSSFTVYTNNSIYKVEVCGGAEGGGRRENRLLETGNARRHRHGMRHQHRPTSTTPHCIPGGEIPLGRADLAQNPPTEHTTFHKAIRQQSVGHPRASEAPKSSQLLSSFCAFRPQESSALQLQVLLQLRLRGITPLIHHPYRNNHGFFSSLFQLSCRSGDVRFSSTEHSRLKSHPENGKNSTPTWDNSKEAAEVLELSEDQQPATAHGGEESNTNSQHSGSSGWQRPAGGAAHHRDPQQLSGSPFGAPRGNLRRVLCL